MRTGAAAGHPGYFHETAFYGSDDELVEVVVPFLRDGVDAGEPAIVACRATNAAVLREALGDTTGIRFLPGADQYARPAATIRTYQRMFAELVAGGARQIRVVGDVPHPGLGADWDAWARYEAAVNHAYDAFPIWGLCPYDTRITPDHVLDDVVATHPHVAVGPGAHLPNGGFRDPRAFLAARPVAVDLLDGVPELVDPTGPEARAATVRACERSGLGQADIDDLVVAVSEAIANAHNHGRPPVRMRLRASIGEVVVTVTDTGAGPTDPLAGMVGPPPGSLGGRGLWLVHQLRSDIAMGVTSDGFTVWLRARALAAAGH